MYGDEVVSMLTVQYRMHELIMNWSSKELYSSKVLKSCLDVGLRSILSIINYEFFMFVIFIRGNYGMSNAMDTTKSHKNFKTFSN